MDTWVDQLNRRAKILMDQVMATRISAQQTGQDFGWLEQQYRDMIERLYAEEYASARLRDTSDLVIRAEGPGADHDAPSLRSFNWLSEHVQKQLTRLSAAMLPMAVSDAKAAAKRLQWSFMGYAPGSIMMGFALHQPLSLSGLEESNREAFDLISNSAQAIAGVPQFVGEVDLDYSINEAIPDPALRDAAIIAAWYLSPTMQSGIHTIEIASRSGEHGTLSQRERMVLNSVIKHPELRTQKLEGNFVGWLRSADLDKRRAVLRDVDGLDSAIRCILDPGLESAAQNFFGGRVKATGRYECDNDGRPRLMYVDCIEPASTPCHNLTPTVAREFPLE